MCGTISMSNTDSPCYVPMEYTDTTRWFSKLMLIKLFSALDTYCVCLNVDFLWVTFYFEKVKPWLKKNYDTLLKKNLCVPLGDRHRITIVHIYQDTYNHINIYENSEKYCTYITFPKITLLNIYISLNLMM